MAEGNGTGRVVIGRETRTLKAPLTEEQRREADREIGQLGVSRRGALEAEEKAKEEHKTLKEAREDLDDRIAELALRLGEGIDELDVEVELQLHLGTNTVTEIRTDTGAVITERAATAEERQAQLELVGPAEPGALRWRKRDGILVAEVEGDGRYEIGGEGDSRDVRFCLEHGASSEVAIGVDLKTAKARASEHAKARAARASAPVVPLNPEAQP